MTPRRPRLIDDRPRRGLSARPQERSGRAIRPLAEPYHTSPAGITEEERRAACLPLTHVKPDSRRARTLALCGLKFVSEPTVPRAWTPLTFVSPPRETKRPGLLRIAAVRTMLAHRNLLRSRGCLPPIYACGLRLQEGTHRQVPDLDRARLLVHGRAGQGAKDRDVPLPTPARAWLRPSWNTHRHPVGSVPAPGRGVPACPRPQHPGPAAVGKTPFGLPAKSAGSISGLPSPPAATAMPPMCWRPA
jgi:integrase